MAVLKSFELNGNKQSFANWISNLSPCDTPFTSMIGKEGINEAQYSWQTDRLAPADNESYEEGSEVEFRKPTTTHEITNFTSILRKVVNVSETAEAVSTYGRGSELAYQMSKAGKEILRDLELMNLTNLHGNPGTLSLASKFAGFEGLVAPVGAPDSDTGAIVHHRVSVDGSAPEWFSQKELFAVTYNLYLVGSKADKIMYHPRHARVFSSMIANNPEADKTYRMFKNTEGVFNASVKKIRDPLGREYTLVPNRYMPEDKIYIFTESDWTQTVLRAPAKQRLSKNGSNERHMIEMEVGLRHRDFFSSGILSIEPTKMELTLTSARPVLAMDVNDITNVVLQATLSDGSPGAGLPVKWFTSNDAVKFDAVEGVTGSAGAQAGRLTGRARPNRIGVCEVWCEVDGIRSKSVSIEVANPIVEITSILPAEIIENTKATVTVSVKRIDGSTVPSGGTVAWDSSAPSFVEYDSTTTNISAGTASVPVKGLKEGVVGLSAKVGSVTSAETPLTIHKEGVRDIIFSVTPGTIVYGESTTLEAIPHNALGEPMTGVDVTFEFKPVISNDPGVIKTNASGIALVDYTPDSNSDYEITASAGGIKSDMKTLTQT